MSSAPQLPCKCGNADPSLFAPLGGETACLLCAYAERRAEPVPAQRPSKGGDLLPAEPFGAWLRERRALGDGWDLLASVAEWHEKGLREVASGEREHVPFDAVDRCMLWDPRLRVEDLYPLAA